MALNLIDAPTLAAALLRLRGETLAQLSRSTGIKPANLSVWLRGAPQVISEKRVVMLLNELGVQGGQLRTDTVHQWRDDGDLADLRFVLGLLVSTLDASRSVVYQERPSGFESLALLEVATALGFAMVFVTAAPSLTDRGLVTAAGLSFGADKTVATLRSLPGSDPQQLRKALHGHLPNWFDEDDDEEVIQSIGGSKDVFLDDALCDAPSFGRPEGEAELQEAVEHALQRGVSMRAIIAAVKAMG